MQALADDVERLTVLSRRNDVVQDGPNLLVLRCTLDECCVPCRISRRMRVVMHRLEQVALVRIVRSTSEVRVSAQQRDSPELIIARDEMQSLARLGESG